jgi:hypothetical protein
VRSKKHWLAKNGDSQEIFLLTTVRDAPIARLHGALR